MSEIVRNAANEVIGKGLQLYNRVPYTMRRDSNQIVVFNTSVSTDNLGDFIIMHYCNQALHEMFGERKYIDISTHQIPSAADEKIVIETKYKFVCGTNLLTSHIEQWWNWRLPDGLRGKLPYRNVILMGVGWGTYQDECSNYSKLIYRSLLNPSVLHSVRDQYTEEKLKAAGIKNVINTGCPTMWKLTPDYCAEIPYEKARKVVTTVTDYRQDITQDNLMLQILSRNYETVYLWLQGKYDGEYLKLLDIPANVVIIPRNLQAYVNYLVPGEIDYVGTRLHAGIFALNHKVRSIIIAVDNRAIEIAKDTNLTILRRENILFELEQKILSPKASAIRINTKNIQRFKAQFL